MVFYSFQNLVHHKLGQNCTFCPTILLSDPHEHLSKVAMPAGIVDDIVGASFLNGVVSNDPMDYNGHGTFVAGVIGAVGNNNVGVTGMNQAISLIACQMLDAEGSSEAPGPSGWATDAVQCIDYCIHKGAHVMSASWGSLVFSAALQV